jgi:hypothetical protein
VRQGPGALWFSKMSLAHAALRIPCAGAKRQRIADWLVRGHITVPCSDAGTMATTPRSMGATRHGSAPPTHQFGTAMFHLPAPSPPPCSSEQMIRFAQGWGEGNTTGRLPQLKDEQTARGPLAVTKSSLHTFTFHGRGGTFTDRGMEAYSASMVEGGGRGKPHIHTHTHRHTC